MNRVEKISRFKYYYALIGFSCSLYLVCIYLVYNDDDKLQACRKLITPVFPLLVLLFMFSLLLIFEFNRLYTEDVIRSRTKQLTAVINHWQREAFTSSL